MTESQITQPIPSDKLASKQSVPAGERTYLVAEQSRLAVASLGGYSYQLWQSLLAWVMIGFDEHLYLEGNEDFDIHRGSTASTTQVKRTSKPITLRSRDAIEAINNFWHARNRNRSVRLTFKFLSTAEVGRETGSYFGGLKGLEVWQAARRGADHQSDLAAAQQIRSFLLSVEPLAAGLRTWLEIAEPADILADLIMPIDWELGTADTADVKLLVEEQLIRIGESMGMLPSNARRAAPALLEKVLLTASASGERVLDRCGLLDTFESATAITLPSTGSGFVGHLARLTGAPAAGIACLASQTVMAAVRDGTPDLPSIHLSRDALVGSIVAKHAEGFVSLHGSTGMGKSTLASLAVSRMLHIPLWLDLRGSGEQHSIIRAATDLIIRDKKFRALVLDDVTFCGDSRPLQNAVAAAFTAARAVGGTIFITSATELPLPLLLRLQLTADCQIKVPALGVSEIEQLLLAHGLTDPGERGRWAKLVYLQTSGHPQLVDARVQALRTRGFPPVAPSDIGSVPSEILEIRQQARLLMAGLPLDQRDLLYRLSLNTLLFSRRSAIRIAGLAPPLSAPGDSLDALVGPWIEKTQGKRFRVSPLAVNAGQDANGDDWAVRTHYAIASQLTRGEVDQFDIVSICFHAVVGGNGRALSVMCVGLLMKEDGLADVADMLSWLVHVNPSDCKFGLDRKSASAVRMAQFEIAACLGADAVEAAVQVLEIETRLPSLPLDSDRSVRLVVICKILMHTEVYLRPPLIVALALELIELQEAAPGINDVLRKVRAASHPGLPNQLNFYEMFATFTPGRLKSAQDLLSLWEALAELPHAKRLLLLTPLTNERTLAQILTDSVWLRECRSDAPSWDDLLSAMLTGYEQARAWGCTGLAVAAAVTSMRILNENLRLNLRAFRFGRRVLQELGEDIRVVDAIADIMDWSDRPLAAYRMRLPIIPAWLPTTVDHFGPALVRRKAAISAARAGEWSAAASYFAEAAGLLVSDTDQRIFRAALLADAGHAASRAGDKPAATALLTTSYYLLRSIPNDPSARKAFRLHKLYGNLVMWLADGTRTNPDGTGNFEPRPGTCSDLEIGKDLSEFPATPVEYSALALCRYAGRMQEGSELQAVLNELIQSPLMVVRCLAGKISVNAALASRDLVATCRAAVRHAKDLVFSMESKDLPDPQLLRMETPAGIHLSSEAVDDLVKKPVLSCLLTMIAENMWPSSRREPPVAVAFNDLPYDVRLWMETVVSLDRMTVDARWNSFRIARKGTDRYSVLMFALSLADDRDAENEQIAHCHATLFQAVKNGSLLPTCEKEMLVIFVRRWSEIAKQAFRLKNPKLTLPGLEAALQCREEGLQKAGRILLAGLPAVGLYVPEWLDKVLRG